MVAIRALAGADLRNVVRDSMVRFLAAYPLTVGLALHFLIPFAAARLAGRYDLSQLYPLLVGFFGLTAMPALGGLVIGLLLLDERDDDTLTALQVTPLPMRAYLGYRVFLPTLLSVVSVYILIPLMGVLPVDYLRLLPIALVSALVAPIFALLFVALAANKVQGLAYMKGLSIFMSGPFAAWFVPEPWQYLFGIFPTYWPLKAFWELEAGRSMWPWLGMGVIVALLWLAPLLRMFTRRLYRTD